MGSYYNLDGVKTYLAKTLDHEKALLDAWKAVTFNTKKDGKPFATLSKNFNNATIGRESYDTLSYEKRIYVYTRSMLSGYIQDSIRLWENVDYLKDSEMLSKTENILDCGSYWCKQYIFDIEDIKKAIQERIAYLEKRCNELQKQIEKADTVYNNFKTAYTKAMEIIKEATKDFTDDTLYYAVIETIKDGYPYC